MSPFTRFNVTAEFNANQLTSKMLVATFEFDDGHHRNVATSILLVRRNPNRHHNDRRKCNWSFDDTGTVLADASYTFTANDKDKLFGEQGCDALLGGNGDKLKQ